LAQQKREERRAQQAHVQALRTQRLMDSLAQKRYGLDAAAQVFGQAQTAQAAAAQAAESRGPSSKYGFKINARYDKDLDAIYNAVRDKKILQEVVDASGNKGTQRVDNPNRRWRNIVDQITGVGISRVQAIMLASKWAPERLKIHGNKSPQVIYRMLKNEYNLTDGQAKNVFRIAGLNWNNRVKKPSRGGGNTININPNVNPASPIVNRPTSITQ
jgi:hypothetical protein